MKTRTLTLISLTILATLLIGAGAVLMLSGGQSIKANVKWDPKSLTWYDSAPATWNAEIWLTGGHKREEIDTTTILLEGTYLKSGTPTPSLHGPKLIVPFHGPDVKAALGAKLPYHMGVIIPGRYRIPLEITGNLTEAYGGTPFAGSGVIVVTVTESGG